MMVPSTTDDDKHAHAHTFQARAHAEVLLLLESAPSHALFDRFKSTLPKLPDHHAVDTVDRSHAK